MSEFIKAQYDAKANRIVATTNHVDRDGEVVDPKGVRNFDDYMKNNPVILWQHNHREAPIGKAINGRILDDRIELDVEWAPTPMGQEVKTLYDNGFMNSFSIGFLPYKSETRNGQFTWSEWDLLETSAVSIPANPMANIIRSAESKGYDLVALKGLYREASLEAELTAAKEVATESDEEEEPEVTLGEQPEGDDMADINTADIEAKAYEKAKADIERKLAETAEADRVAGLEAELKDLKLKDEERRQAKDVEEPKIKVGTNPDYKGISLKKGVEVFADQLRKRGQDSAASNAVANEERTMGLVRSFQDLVINAKGMDITMKDQVTTTDSKGGYLTPDIQGELLAYARLSSVALRDARVVNMVSDVMKMPRELTKVNLGFTTETATAGVTSATFDQVTLTAGDLDGYADVSMHLEMDSTTPIAALLLDQFTESFGQKIDSAVFAGTGDPVSGVFASYGRSEVFASTSTNFSSVVVGHLISAEGKLERPRRAGAKWYTGRSTLWSNIYPLKNTGGDHYLITDLSRPGARTLLGYPVEEVEEYPANAVSTAMAIFGNLQGFIIGNRLGNLTLFRDPYSLSTYHHVRYVFWTRVAFANALPNNFVALETAAS